MGVSAVALYSTPGLSVFATVDQPVRDLLEINGRCFCVGGTKLYEISSSGSVTVLGVVGNDEKPAMLSTNGTLGHQLMCYSSGAIYCYDLKLGTFTGPIQGLQGTPSMLVFCSSYFVALLANSNKFQVSGLLDGTNWNALSVQQNETFPENISAIKSAYGFLFVLGSNGHSQVYYNSGANQYTPFSPIQGAYMEEGCGAPYSPVVMDNTVFWVGGKGGVGDVAWRANGYSPLRVSNFAVETAWASYPAKGSDAVGYTYRDQGHTFWVLRFPSANNGRGATWVYDASMQAWHERGTWGDAGEGAHLSTCHCEVFGQHLVGDWQSGNVYSMSIGTYTDNGAPIRRLRRSPHLIAELTRIFLAKVQFEVETGLGPAVPAPPGSAPGPIPGSPIVTDNSGNQYALSMDNSGALITSPQSQVAGIDALVAQNGPKLLFRISRDGGKTYGVEYSLDCGQQGEYRKRVIQRRLGQARDFVFEIVATDPVPWRIIDGYVEGTGFQAPQQRMISKIAQVA